MANTLLIEKQNGGYFKFTLNGDTSNAITSIQNDLLAVGNELHFKTGNGANIIKEQSIYPADVTIIAAGTFTFTTVAAVWNKLIEVGYFDWLGGGVGGVDRFDELLDTFQYTGNAGKAVIVDNSELKLVPITLYNKRLFTELEDTPSSLVPDKMVVVNPAGTALILKDQPEPPEDFLNSVGYFDYNDLATQTTPLSVVANVPKKLTNDTEGANTSTDQTPYGVSYVWDYTTNQFNFNELEVGDTIDIRIHVQVTTTSANQKVDIKAKFGIGSVSEFENTIYENVFKTSGLHEVNFVAPFYMGSAYITDYPAELYLTSDASATVIVDGWYVRILRKNINIITVDYQVEDATTTVKGVVRLAGDLSGTANNPTVPELANKVPTSRTVSTTSPLLGGGALSSNLTLSIQQANSVDSGYLSNVDWSTFNNKQGALNGTGFVKISGTTISYDNSTYALDSVVVKLTGDQSISGLKTFTGAAKFDSNINLSKTGTFSVPSLYNTIGAYNTEFKFGIDSSRIAIVDLASLTAPRIYNYPDKDGIFAMTSDLHSAVTIGTANGLSLSGQELSLGLSSASTNGALSSTDWTTFNSKQGALNGTGFVKISGTTISYDNSVYALDNAVVKLTGDQAITGNKTFSNAVQAGAFKLTGMTAGSGALYWTSDRVTLANYNINGVVEIEALGGSSIATFGNAIDFTKTVFVSSNLYANGLISRGTPSNTLDYLSGSGAIFIRNTADERAWAFQINTSDSLDLWNINSGGTTSRKLTITSGGNVGIGTTSPATLLQVKGNGNNMISLQYASDGGAAGYGFYNSSGTELWSIGGGRFVAQDALEFSRQGSLKMLINSSGNVGIGTTSPSKKFEVIGNASFNEAVYINGANSILNLGADQGGGAVIKYNGNGNLDITPRAGYSSIFTSGNVGIGTTSPSYQLQLSTDSAAKPTSALWTIASDERIKENINSYTKGLNELLKINPITYDYNGLGGFKKGKGGVGIIAQEIAEILPDSVSSIKGKLNETDEEEIDILNFNGHELTYILINAVKELKAEIEILKNK